MRSKAYRASFFVISLLIISFGVNLIVRADMGNSPLTATPYTCSAIIPEITFGTWTIIWSVVVIIVEKILMGRDMGTGQVLMQLFMSLVFGYFVDFTSWILGDVQPDGYLTQLLSLVLGCAIMAFGICIELKSNFTMLAADGLILAIHTRTGIPFGKVKLIIDVMWSVLSLILGLTIIHGFVGTREGTIIAALLVGPMIRLLQRRFTVLSKSISEKDAS